MMRILLTGKTFIVKRDLAISQHSYIGSSRCQSMMWWVKRQRCDGITQRVGVLQLKFFIVVDLYMSHDSVIPSEVEAGFVESYGSDGALTHQMGGCSRSGCNWKNDKKNNEFLFQRNYSLSFVISGIQTHLGELHSARAPMMDSLFLPQCFLPVITSQKHRCHSQIVGNHGKRQKSQLSVEENLILNFPYFIPCH